MPPTAPVAPTGWLLALVPVMFSYSGWNAAVYVAEEIRDPVRNVPRALAIGTGARWRSTSRSTRSISASCRWRSSAAASPSAKWRPSGCSDRPPASLFAVVAIVIILSSLSAMTTAGPRVYFAMARDGVFVPAAARVHPRYRTPAVAIVAQAVWSSLLVLSGTFEQLLTYTGFGVILFSALAVLSLFFVRRTATQAATVPRLGLSLGAGALLPRQLRDRRQHDRRSARRGVGGPGRDGGRRADVLVDEAKAPPIS